MAEQQQQQQQQQEESLLLLDGARSADIEDPTTETSAAAAADNDDYNRIIPNENLPLLLSSRGSVSLNEQVVYSSLGSLVSNASSAALLTDDEEEEEDIPPMMLELKTMTIWEIICILSTAFSYGCILTTLFLITLPVECQRIESEHPTIPKSVALGNFVAIAGVTQLVSPFIGRLSDTFQPPPPKFDIGQRLPYLVLGSVLTVFGLLGQMFASYRSFWVRYSFAFFAHMIGLNIMYAMMLAIIPDQVPHTQTGIANGILAALLVTGSLFGFGLFHGFLRNNIQSMYGLYTCIVIISSILTGIYGHDRDVDMALHRKQQQRRIDIIKKRKSQKEQGCSPSSDLPISNNFHDNNNNNDHDIDEQNQGQRTSKNDNIKKKKKKKKNHMIRKIKKATKKVTETVVVTPTIILRSMLVDTIKDMNCHALYQSYTLDMNKHRDFFWVTVSRLFYYCGMSVQTFFMYFLHDIIHLENDPEGAVATLSILGQLAGAFTCVPVGIASDKLFSGKRKPFVYFACFVLAGTTFSAIFARTMHGMVIIMLALGGANGVYLTMDTSLAVDTLPKEFDGESGSAQLLGIWGVAAFLGSALGPMIGGPVLYFVGSKANADEGDGAASYTDDDYDDGAAITTQGYTLKGYAVLLSLSSFYFAMSSLSLRFVRH